MARASSWSFPAMNKAEALAVVMPEYLETRPDMASRLRKLRVFGQVICNEDLSGFVVSHPLQGQVGDLNKWSGYRSLARAYEPFLVFRFECVGARGRVRYRMIVTRADKLDNIFVGDVLAISKARLETISLLTLGAGLRESNCFGATDHGAVDVLFASMSHWLHENLSAPMNRAPVRPPRPCRSQRRKHNECAGSNRVRERDLDVLSRITRSRRTSG